MSSRFKIAKEDIINLFSSNGNRVYTPNDIAHILDVQRRFWRLPVNMTAEQFIELLVNYTPIKEHYFDFPARRLQRFVWGEVSIFRLALSLEKEAYLSHYSALYLHGLTEQIPKKIYATYEQPKKNIARAELLQSSIDNAFIKAVRSSRNIAEFEDYRICLLNGQFTDKLGVVEIMNPENEKNLITNIERTLIDIAVRPAYSGGIHEVLHAYIRAAKKVSINKLSAMLKKLDYIYPYHQAIGFYLQKAGNYRESQIQLLKNFDFKYDFYIDHEMKEVDT
jgi:hypothetical protein